MKDDQIQITFHHVDATDAIRDFAEKHLERLHKYVSYPLKMNLILTVERQEHKAELTCHAEHKEMSAMAKTGDMYSSITSAVEKMEVQFKKERDKRKGHNKAHAVNGHKGDHLAQDLEAQIPHQRKRQ